MKVAVSIPDETFSQADALARRMSMSRSRVYTEAIKEYLDRRNHSVTADSINRAIELIGEDDSDPFVRAAAAGILRETEW